MGDGFDEIVSEVGAVESVDAGGARATHSAGFSKFGVNDGGGVERFEDFLSECVRF